MHLFMPKTLFTKYPAMRNFDPLYFGEPSTDLFGLYHPIGDLFMAIGSDLDFLQEVSFLFSSRYILYTCRLNTATNYHPNLIDNRVCNTWTVGDKSAFAITRFPDLYSIQDITLLQESHKSVPWFFNNDQDYIGLAYHYIRTIVPILDYRATTLDDTQYPQELNARGIRLKNRVTRLPLMPFKNKFQSAIDNIYQIIYTEFDASVAGPLLKQTIQGLV